MPRLRCEKVVGEAMKTDWFGLALDIMAAQKAAMDDPILRLAMDPKEHPFEDYQLPAIQEQDIKNSQIEAEDESVPDSTGDSQ